MNQSQLVSNLISPLADLAHEVAPKDVISLRSLDPLKAGFPPL